MTKSTAILILILSTQSAIAQSADANILREVREFYSGYVTAFTSQQAEELADNYMKPPLYLRIDDEMDLLRSRQEVLDYLSSAFANLSDQNYVSSEILANNFCILTDTSAIVSVAFRRFDSDGNIILESGASYGLVKINGGWRFAMLSISEVDRVLSCNN